MSKAYSPQKIDRSNKVYRPKMMHTARAEYIKNHLVERMSEESIEIINAQIEAAKGKSVQVTDSEKFGVTTVTGIPNVNAAKLLFEQVLGRPKETHEVKGTVGILNLVMSLEKDD